MANPSKDYGLEQITICPNCKHCITLTHPPTTYDELLSLSRKNTTLSKYSDAYPSLFSEKERIGLNDEIAKLEETLALLKRRQEENILREKAWLSLSSPVRRLPVEIFSEVLTYCCRSDTGSSEKSSNQFKTHGYMQTLVLSHVNSYWRNVSLSRPVLWSDISVCLPVEEKPAVESLLDLYFARSQNVPLDISLDVLDVEYHLHVFGGNGAHRIINLLGIPGRSRCRRLAADCKLFEMFNLDRIFLSITDLAITDKNNAYKDWEIDSFLDCRSLRRVSLEVDIAMPELAWDQIEQVEMRSGHLEDLSFLEENAPSVSSVTISGLATSAYDTEASLTSLNSLCLKDMPQGLNGPECLKALLSHLTCPNLTHLTMHSGSTTEEWPLEESITFLGRTSLISTLELNSLRLPSCFLVGCLPHLPNITHLVITDCVDSKAQVEAVSEDFIRSLIWLSSVSSGGSGEDSALPTTTNLLPSLQSLHIGGISFRFDKVFADFLSSRRGHGSSVSELVEVNLKFIVMNFELLDEENLQLKELCREGLKVFDYGYMLDGDKRPFSGSGGWLHRVRAYSSPEVHDVE